MSEGFLLQCRSLSPDPVLPAREQAGQHVLLRDPSAFPDNAAQHIQGRPYCTV